jgi:hypothetical protein
MNNQLKKKENGKLIDRKKRDKFGKGLTQSFDE